MNERPIEPFCNTENPEAWAAIADWESNQRSKILKLIMDYSWIEGIHHNQWMLDQIARVAAGNQYEEWVEEMETDEHGDRIYAWDKGIAP